MSFFLNKKGGPSGESPCTMVLKRHAMFSSTCLFQKGDCISIGAGTRYSCLTRLQLNSSATGLSLHNARIIWS